MALLWRDFKYSANKILTSLVANQWSRGNFYRRWIASVWLNLFKLLFIPSLQERENVTFDDFKRNFLRSYSIPCWKRMQIQSRTGWWTDCTCQIPQDFHVPPAKNVKQAKYQAKIFLKEKPVLKICSLFVFYLNFWDKGINSASRIIWRDYTIGWIN